MNNDVGVQREPINHVITVHVDANKETGRITSTVDVFGQVMRQIMDTNEHGIRRALIDLGWTPPAPDAEDIAIANLVERQRDALYLVRMAMRQGMSLDGRISSNGPTVGEIIAEALGEKTKEGGQ